MASAGKVVRRATISVADELQDPSLILENTQNTYQNMLSLLSQIPSLDCSMPPAAAAATPVKGKQASVAATAAVKVRRSVSLRPLSTVTPSPQSGSSAVGPCRGGSPNTQRSSTAPLQASLANGGDRESSIGTKASSTTGPSAKLESDAASDPALGLPIAAGIGSGEDCDSSSDDEHNASLTSMQWLAKGNEVLKSNLALESHSSIASSSSRTKAKGKGNRATGTTSGKRSTKKRPRPRPRPSKKSPVAASSATTGRGRATKLECQLLAEAAEVGVEVPESPTADDYLTNPYCKPAFKVSSLILRIMYANHYRHITLDAIYDSLKAQYAYYRKRDAEGEQQQQQQLQQMLLQQQQQQQPEQREQDEQTVNQPQDKESTQTTVPSPPQQEDARNRRSTSGWKNTVRHALSTEKFFKSERRSDANPGRGGLWRVDLDLVPDKVTEESKLYEVERNANPDPQPTPPPPLPSQQAASAEEPQPDAQDSKDSAVQSDKPDDDTAQKANTKKASKSPRKPRGSGSRKRKATSDDGSEEPVPPKPKRRRRPAKPKASVAASGSETCNPADLPASVGDESVALAPLIIDEDVLKNVDADVLEMADSIRMAPGGGDMSRDHDQLSFSTIGLEFSQSFSQPFVPDLMKSMPCVHAQQSSSAYGMVSTAAATNMAPHSAALSLTGPHCPVLLPNGVMTYTNGSGGGATTADPVIMPSTPVATPTSSVDTTAQLPSFDDIVRGGMMCTDQERDALLAVAAGVTQQQQQQPHTHLVHASGTSAASGSSDLTTTPPRGRAKTTSTGTAALENADNEELYKLAECYGAFKPNSSFGQEQFQALQRQAHNASPLAALYKSGQVLSANSLAARSAMMSPGVRVPIPLPPAGSFLASPSPSGQEHAAVQPMNAYALPPDVAAGQFYQTPGSSTPRRGISPSTVKRRWQSQSHSHHGGGGGGHPSSSFVAALSAGASSQQQEQRPRPHGLFGLADSPSIAADASGLNCISPISMRSLAASSSSSMASSPRSMRSLASLSSSSLASHSSPSLASRSDLLQRQRVEDEEDPCGVGGGVEPAMLTMETAMATPVVGATEASPMMALHSAPLLPTAAQSVAGTTTPMSIFSFNKDELCVLPRNDNNTSALDQALPPPPQQPQQQQPKSAPPMWTGFNGLQVNIHGMS
eukprot:scpid40309/ scgid28700/ 